MYDFFKGIVEYKKNDHLVLLNNGIGYKIFASMNTLKELELYEEHTIFVELIVREDSLSLYGFYNELERDVYRLLTTVSGVGPKVALGLLSGLDLGNLVNAIKGADTSILTKAPGIGKKTADRIILELRDKMDGIVIENTLPISNNLRDAEDALGSLGYSNFEVVRVLKEIYVEGMSLEEIIKVALRNLVR